MEDTYSVFKVYSYKGGELSTDINCNEESVINIIIESGNLTHPKLPYSDSYFELNREEFEKIIPEIKYDNCIYAGGDTGPVLKIYKHVDSKLVPVMTETFLPKVLEIMKNECKG